jgi:transcriptional regulator with XRE-family HTH domain
LGGDDWGDKVSLNATKIDQHVGARMRKRREALGISQGRLGRQLGLTFSQIQKYEKGSNRIGAGRLYQISVFLNAPLGYFFEGLEGATPELLGASPVRDDASELIEAFSSISGTETRQSVLALVRSLSGRPAVSGN